jgi:recombination DNA repair RAD52 pathway protein
VRISVRAGDAIVVREGHGTGHGSGASAGEVHDIALKAAETDATKRALATFGKPFGLALYGRIISSPPVARTKQS